MISSRGCYRHSLRRLLSSSHFASPKSLSLPVSIQNAESPARLGQYPSTPAFLIKGKNRSCRSIAIANVTFPSPHPVAQTPTVAWRFFLPPQHLAVRYGSIRNFATKRQQRAAAAAAKTDKENDVQQLHSNAEKTNNTKENSSVATSSQLSSSSSPPTVLGTPRTGMALNPNNESSQRIQTTTDHSNTTIDQTASSPSSSSSQRLIRTNLEEHIAHLRSTDPNYKYAQSSSSTTTITATPTETNTKSQSSPPSLEPNPLGTTNADPADMIDFLTMYDPTIHLPDKPNFGVASLGYEPSTPLCDELMKYIGVRGPITVAEYMRWVLTHPRFGYYTNMNRDHDDDDFDDEVEDVEDDELFPDDDDYHDTTPRSTVDKQGQFGGVSATAGGGGGGEILGPKGDFTTAPEISQIFGECVAVWFMTQYRTLGNPRRVQLVEIGPGKGTLMADLLRTFVGGMGGAFVELGDAIARGGGVHLVEVMGGMRGQQRECLEKLEKEIEQKKEMEVSGDSFKFQFEFLEDTLEETEQIEWRGGAGTATGLHLPSEWVTTDVNKGSGEEITNENQNLIEKDSENVDKIKVQWHTRFSTVPTHDPVTKDSIPTFVICQEFIDALPVHVFQKTEEGWRERLVDVAIKDHEEHDDKGGDGLTTSSESREGSSRRSSSNKFVDAEKTASSPSKEKLTHFQNQKKPRLRFVLPPDTTPAVRTLLNVDKSGRTKGPNAHLDDADVGDIVEVCPEGLMLVQDIASRIKKCTGAALIVDYGNEGSGDTIRAFRRHQQVHVLSSPGRVDVTADVDFAALREAVNSGMYSLHERRTVMNESGTNAVIDNGSAPSVKDEDMPSAFGPVTQGKFLASMGAMERVVKLIEDDSTTDEQAEELYTALERLVLPEQMGERYKVLAVAKKKDGIFAPPGF